MLRRLLLPALLCTAIHCADLAPIPEGTCGNQVVEAGEDCDGHPDETLGDGLVCGAPGSDSACRYVCDGPEKKCPLGWGCGLDGQCRSTTGELVAGPRTERWSPVSLAAADLDGDGIVDLVGAFGDHVEFRNGDATGVFVPGIVEQTWPVTGEVAVATLDSDGFEDVLLPTQQGVQVWRGQPLGRPLPVAYSAVPVDSTNAVMVVPIRDPSEPLSIAFVEGAIGVEGVVIVGFELQAPPNTPIAEGAVVGDLTGRIAVMDFNHDARDDVAIGLRGATSVQVYGIGKSALNSEPRLGALSAAGPHIDISQARSCARCPSQFTTDLHIEGGVLVADVNGDGNHDLVVGVTGPAISGDAVLVAPGDGTGGFDEPYLDLRFERLASPDTAAAGVPVLSPSTFPLAAADIDGDGVADYVSPNGVFVSKGDLDQVAVRDRMEPWTAAVLEDFDGDGARDVAAISQGESFVDVLISRQGPSGDLGFLSSPLRAARGVKGIRAGMLHGPATRDIVLVEGGPADSAEPDSLSVAYGQPLDYPNDPVVQATFHRIEQLEVGRASLPTADTFDNFEDVVLSARSASGVTSIGLLYGIATERLRSAFFLLSIGGYAAANRVLPGRFSGSSAYDDLLLLAQATSGPPRLFFVPGADEAAFAAATSSQKPPEPFDVGGPDDTCGHALVGDIDGLEGDGRDEMIAVIKDGVVVDVGVAGSKNTFGCDPVTPDTLFGTGFVTELLTAIAVLDAVEDGALSLDAPITDVIPGLAVEPGRGDASQITLQHLLTNSSMYRSASSANPIQSNCTALADAFENAVDGEIQATPGSMHNPPAWNNYEIAGLARENADGVPFSQAVAARVLSPLGLGGSFDPDVISASDHSESYFTNLSSAPLTNTCPNHAPAMGYHTSIRDLAKLVAYATGGAGDVLEPSTRAAMLEPQGPLFWSDSYAPYGLIFGFHKTDIDPVDEVLWTQGWVNGFSHMVVVFKARGLAVVALTSAEGSSSVTIAEQVALIYDPSAVFYDPPEHTPSPGALESVVGTYHDPFGFDGESPRTVEVRLEQGQLVGTLTSEGGVPEDISFQPEYCDDNFIATLAGSTTIGVRFWRDDVTGEPYAAQIHGDFGPPFFRVP